MPSPNKSTEITAFTIASRLNKPVHRIMYMVRNRNIPHTRNALGWRIFDDQAVEQIADEIALLDQVRARRQAVKPAC